MFVPVVDQDQRPLMPTTPARARRWIKRGNATAFWKGGIFCVQFNREPSDRDVAVGGKPLPDHQRLVCVAPLVWHRRQLHRFQPESGGKRKPYGGTLSQGIKRGTLVVHPKWGKATVGGTMDGRLSLHDPETHSRLTQTAKVMDCHLVKLLRWRTRLLPLRPLPKKGRRASSPASKARGLRKSI